MMKCTVNYSNGQQSEDYDSIQAAMAALLAQYPDGYALDAGGFRRDEQSEDKSYDVRSGRAAMIWDDEQSSENDDGAYSVATINVPDND